MSTSDSPRVAIIAVHGVADQQPGDTARALADLLVVASPDALPGGPRYSQVGSADLGLRVSALPPSPSGDSNWALGPRSAELPPLARLARAWRQSMGSDLYRSKPGALLSPAATPAMCQPDLELTDFLLAQSQRNAMPPDSYDTQRLDLERRPAEGRAAENVHIYEMYWADLSRLAGNVPRILTELFTLISRLSQLGRDTVAAAARQFGAAGQPRADTWRRLDKVQAAADWLFSRVLAQLMLQLLVLTLVLVPLGYLVGREGLQSQLRVAFLWLLPFGVWLTWVYRRAPHAVGMVVSILAAVALGLLLSRIEAAAFLGVIWLVVLGALTDWLLRICDARFPMTRLAGGAMAIVSLGTVLVIGLGPDQWLHMPDDTVERVAGLQLFQSGALRAVEWLLLATATAWVVMGPVLLAWLLLGLRASGTQGFAGRASVATGRLGLFASMAFFLILVMASWALVHPLLMSAVGSMAYEPLAFRTGPAGIAEAACVFLDERYRNSNETFALVAVLVFCVVLYLVLGLLPALLAELKLLRGAPLPLGRWLTRTYRYLDRMMLALIALAVVVTLLVAVDLVLTRWGGADKLPVLAQFMGWVRGNSLVVLSPLTLALAAASATAAITVLGGLLSRYLPGIRAPLDVALDVDNHFREFPRKGIPRARIFSRFAALLRHVHEQGYERIVIVAHSQGTVLTAEMLRYLHARAAQPADNGEAALLGRELQGRLQLMTAGCPLRQLYASRFPVLYPWVLESQQEQTEDGAQERCGPTIEAIGVQRWVNVYTTGDYVGRWLWSRKPAEGEDVSDTILDTLSEPLDVYRAEQHISAARTRLASRTHMDVCLGTGAHTHYFESDQGLVAALIDGLIETPGPTT